jgi:hypothetical protein
MLIGARNLVIALINWAWNIDLEPRRGGESLEMYT